MNKKTYPSESKEKRRYEYIKTISIEPGAEQFILDKLEVINNVDDIDISFKFNGIKLYGNEFILLDKVADHLEPEYDLYLRYG